MSRLTVYRVEHEWTGEGPFAGPHAARAALDSHCAKSRRVPRGAHHDVAGFQAGFHFCGVGSVADLHEWFGPLRERLLEAGYVLVKYEPLASNVRRGRSGRQLAFPKYEATPREIIGWPAYEPAQMLLPL